MNRGTVAAKAPVPVEVQAGRTYWWCVCGLSASQPFCDGSHRTTAFTPLSYAAEETKTLWFCACKQTARQPFCDGTHNRL